MKKPESVVKIISAIKEKEKITKELNTRKNNLEKQRPRLAFKDPNMLEKLDAELQKIIKDLDTYNLEITGAKEVLKIEIEDWITEEQKRLEESAVKNEKAANELKTKINEHIEALKELNGSDVMIAFTGNQSKEGRLRFSAEVDRNSARSIRDEIKKEMKEYIA